MKRPITLALAILATIAVPVLAQDHSHDTPAAQQGGMMMRGGMRGMSNMQGMQNMGSMLGQHMMAATVTAIDGKTGLVDVSAGTMSLKLHFPPASLAGVKVGDAITVHMAFQKG